MIPLIIAVLMWVVVAGAALSRWRGGERSVLVASVCIAVSLTLNIDSLYRAADRLLSGANRAELLSDLALMIGVSFLVRGISRTTGRPAGRSTRLRRVFVAMLAMVAVTVLFCGIRAPRTSTLFMLDYGRQPAAAAYSIVQFSYVGAAMFHLAVICIRHAPEHSSRTLRASFRILAAGSALVCLLCLDIFAMDLTHLAGRLELMRAASVVYEPVYLLAAALLTVGYCLPALSASIRSLRNQRRCKELTAALAPIWDRTAGPEAARIPPPAGRDSGTAGADNVLHRMVVEIRDASLRHGDLLTAEELHVLDAAEHYLMPDADLTARIEP